MPLLLRFVQGLCAAGRPGRFFTELWVSEAGPPTATGSSTAGVRASIEPLLQDRLGGAGVAGAHHLCCNGDGSPSTSRSVPHWMQPTFPSFAPNIHCPPTHTEPYLKLGDPLGCVSLVLRLVEEEAAVLSAPGITVSPAKTCAGLFQLRTPAAPDAHLTYVNKCTCRGGTAPRHPPAPQRPEAGT